MGFDDVNKRGAQSLPIETRTHVGIDRKTLAAEDGRLFQTARLRLCRIGSEASSGLGSYRYGFMIRTAADLQDNSVVRFGGEGRLSRLNKNFRRRVQTARIRI